jgi:hypothetical protein
MIIKAVAEARPVASPPAVREAVEITSPASLRITVLVTVSPAPEMRPRIMAIGMIQSNLKKVVIRSSFSG